MTDAVSGWPLLVERGKPRPIDCKDALCTGATARTAVAIADGRVLLAVVAAPGISLADLARWLANLDAQSALNLDGGGSTSLVIEGRIRTGSTLHIPTHLGVKKSAAN
ncbi:MAG: phosphodiester glycosidase family protein [Myxococcales bacterium]